MLAIWSWSSHVDVDDSEGRDVAEVRDGLPERVVRRLQGELNQLAVAHCERRDGPTMKRGIKSETQWRLVFTTDCINIEVRKPCLNHTVQRWAKRRTLGCEKCLPSPAWLLLSKTGPSFCPSLKKSVEHHSRGLPIMMSKHKGEGVTNYPQFLSLACSWNFSFGLDFLSNRWPIQCHLVLFRAPSSISRNRSPKKH